MSAARRFTVLTTGEIESGFDETQVALNFANLLNTTPERAIAFVFSEQSLVEDVDEERALAYQKKLGEIGMGIRVVASDELTAANDAQLDSSVLSFDSEEPTPIDDDSESYAQDDLLSEIDTTTNLAEDDLSSDILIDFSDAESANDDAESYVAQPLDEDLLESELNSLKALHDVHEPADVPASSTSAYSGEEIQSIQNDVSDGTVTTKAFADMPEEDILQNIREAGNAIEVEKSTQFDFSVRNRSLRLLVLAIISALLAASIYVTRPDSFSVSSRNLDAYKATNTASEEMNTLLEVSGMQSEANLFSSSMLSRFQTYFKEHKSNSAVLTEDRYIELMKWVPQAYNKDALNNTIANWLQKNTFEDDIPALIDAFNQPNIQAFIELRLTKTRDKDLDGYLAFQDSLRDEPLNGARQRALTRLLDALILDKVDYEIEGDVQRAVITTRGAIGPDKDSEATKTRVRTELRDMRDKMVFARPDIRRDALHELGWQLQESSIEEIHAIRGTLDDSSVRELYRQMVKAYEEYLKNTTLWLQRQM